MLDIKQFVVSEISRDTIKDLLTLWQEGRLTPLDIYVRAEEIEETFLKAWPTDEDYAKPIPELVAIRALHYITILNDELITEADIPFFLWFLEAPVGSEKAALKAIDEYFSDERWLHRRDTMYENLLAIPRIYRVRDRRNGMVSKEYRNPQRP